MTETAAIEDGRRARRIRNRDAVVDAMLDLIVEVNGMPSTEDIARRADVSVSSLFRYFDGIEDLLHDGIEHYFARYAPLFEVPALGQGTRDQRIERFVAARIKLFDSIAPIARLARSRAYDRPQFTESLVRARSMFSEQVSSQFAVELDSMSDEVARTVAELIDTLCSFEAWDLQHTAHGRSATQTECAWSLGITRLLSF